MRLVVIMGVVMLGLLGAAFVLTFGPALRTALNPAPPLVALETTLGRPLVVYVDGPEPAGFQAALTRLDDGVQALATQATPQRLIDLDTYVMVRKDWDVFRAIDGHDLSDLIRQSAADKARDTGLAWFEATLSAPDHSDQRVLVILATDAALDNLGAFCFALTVYELARFSHNGLQVINAASGPGTRWLECRKRGWNSAADLPVTE